MSDMHGGAVAPALRRKVQTRVVTSLGVAITSGRCEPGSRLPDEISGARSHRASRTVYREAVRVLIGKGLLESRPKTGTRVLPRRNWSVFDADVLGWAFTDRPCAALLEDLREVRRIVAPAAAAAAAGPDQPTAELRHLRVRLDDADAPADAGWRTVEDCLLTVVNAPWAPAAAFFSPMLQQLASFETAEHVRRGRHATAAAELLASTCHAICEHRPADARDMMARALETLESLDALQPR